MERRSTPGVTVETTRCTFAPTSERRRRLCDHVGWQWSQIVSRRPPERISASCYHRLRSCLVQDEALHRIKLAGPGSQFQDAAGVGIPSLPAFANAARAEVDVFGVILAIQRRRQQANHVHAGQAAISRQLLDSLGLTLRLRQVPDELGDHMPEPMDLVLPGHMTGGAAGILVVLVAAPDLPEVGR